MDSPSIPVPGQNRLRSVAISYPRGERLLEAALSRGPSPAALSNACARRNAAERAPNSHAALRQKAIHFPHDGERVSDIQNVRLPSGPAAVGVHIDGAA